MSVGSLTVRCFDQQEKLTLLGQQYMCMYSPCIFNDLCTIISDDDWYYLGTWLKVLKNTNTFSCNFLWKFQIKPFYYLKPSLQVLKSRSWWSSHKTQRKQTTFCDCLKAQFNVMCKLISTAMAPEKVNFHEISLHYMYSC